MSKSVRLSAGVAPLEFHYDNILAETFYKLVNIMCNNARSVQSGKECVCKIFAYH